MTILANASASSHTLEVNVPRQTSWHVPRGSYPSHIRSVNILNRCGAFKTARITFNVHVPGATVDYLAKVDLTINLAEGSDLWNLICRLLNRKALQDRSGSTFNLDGLIGLPCDIEIDHNHDKAEDYAFPLVVVTNVQEEGRLVKPSVVHDKTKDTGMKVKDTCVALTNDGRKGDAVI